MSDALYDIVAIGEGLVEFNQRDPARPEFHRGYGGDTSNAVIAAARLGARCAYISQVGDDAFGHELLALWQREKIDTEGVRVVHGGQTGLYFVTHHASGAEGGHQFSYRRANSPATQLTPGHLPRALLARTQWLHVSGISLAISPSACDAVLDAVALARAEGAQVSFDLNHRARLSSGARALALARAVLQQCDLFLPSLDEIHALTGIGQPDAVIDWAHAQGASRVALKLGAQGCRVSDGLGRESLPAHPVQALDATGAGDCFAGACLVQLARGLPLAQAARAANVAAALSTRGWGAVAPLPRAADMAAAGIAWPY
ncbi:sugar kinase [Aquabacterium sp. OR-4]|uniref:sugar kinase n=1 Tax=Aquabacterium sp. OR-4 TaxID=2978127 RepID=UPI0028C8D9D4|nr:sugar kinase [Aquabacterium sp. OR-4]MDT7834020.1 sugar kinase [Aquabacterium sp. OR-4]